MKQVSRARLLLSTCGLLIFLTIFASPVFCQDTIAPIDVAKLRMSQTLSGKLQVYGERPQNITGTDISLLPYATDNKLVFRQLKPAQVQKDWHLKFRLQNSSDTAIPVYFMPGIYCSIIELYKKNKVTGQTTLLPDIAAPIKDSLGYRKILVQGMSDDYYFARLRFVKTSVNVIDPRIIKDYFLPSFSKNYKISVTNTNIYTYIIAGILLMMIFYSLAVFFLNGSIEFLYYASFAFLMGLLFFMKAYFYHTPHRFNYYFESFLDFVVQCLGTYFYLAFLRKFIVAKKNFPFLHKLFVLGQILIVLVIVIFYYLNFYTDNFVMQDMLENVTKYIWSLTTIIFIVYAVIHKNKMLNYLAIGHFFLLLAGIFSLLLIRFPRLLGENTPPILKDSLFYYEVGLTIELIFFLIALAFKSRRDLIDRTKERERLKLENERKEFEKQLAIVGAKQEERNRISADMHDELGSGVTAIRLMSEIVKTKMKDTTLPEIDRISNSANDLLMKMNTIIWTMTSSNDRLDNLVAYIRSHALEFFESTNMDCHFQSDENIPPTEISGEKRRNLFLCVKESLNNVAKHSRGTDVWIKVNLYPGKMEILIHDNGPGINMEKLREFGNGLKNMHKRMESIDGTFEIENREGTRTRFTLPV